MIIRNKECWSLVFYSASSQGKAGKKESGSPGLWTVTALNHSRSVKLNDGHFMPVLGFGTYALEEVSGAQGTGGLNANSLEGSSADLCPHAWYTLGDLD